MITQWRLRRSRNPVTREKAAERLGSHGGTRAVKPLIAALRDEEFTVQLAAAHALAELGDVAVEPLTAALGDHNDDVRQAAVRGLGELGGARAVGPLTAALGDPDSRVRRWAVEALGEIGDARAAEALVTALRDKDRDARQAAVEAPGQPEGGSQRGQAASAGRYGDEAVRLGPAVAAPLVAALGDEDQHVSEYAAIAVRMLGDAATAPLIAALGPPRVATGTVVFRSPGSLRRSPKAADALHALGAAAVQPLITALRGGGEGGAKAAALLGKLGGERAVEPLIAALADEAACVREAAARALGKIGDARAVEPLIAARRDKDRDVRQAAVEALGEIGGTRAVEALIAALRDKVWLVRRAAVEALGELGGARAVGPLTAALRDKDAGVRRAAAEALARIGDARAVEPLIAALADKDPRARLDAAEALGRIGDARAVEPLIVAFQNHAHLGRVTEKALRALGQQSVPLMHPVHYGWVDESEKRNRNVQHVIQFACSNCGGRLTALAQMMFSADLACGICGKPVTVPPVPCVDDRCVGLYEICGGDIEEFDASSFEYDRTEYRCAKCRTEHYRPKGRRCDSIRCNKCGNLTYTANLQPLTPSDLYWAKRRPQPQPAGG